MNRRKNLIMRLAFCVLMLTLALAVPAGAVTRYVSPGQSIQAAIDAASNGDEIEVAPGIYNEAIDFKGKAVHLYGSGGPGVTTIDANGLNSSVVTCNSGENANTVLEGFMITGGSAENGGGMYNDGSSPTVTNCTFSGNTATESGGGMYNWYNSNPTVTDCTFTSNTASSNGGGMYNYVDNSPTVNNCIFSGNTANYDGGGMYNYDNSSPTVTNCTFTGNSVSLSGGGMYNGYQSHPTVTDCNFINNTAHSGDIGGGGMYNDNVSEPTVTNCTFSGNTANRDGGGMYNNRSSGPTVTNCNFSGNSAEWGGGGMFNWSVNSTVTDCTFSGNSASHSGGGGMYNGYSRLTVTNCTFSNNSAGWVGGGMRNNASWPTVINCTFTSNTASSNGGGMHNSAHGSPTVTNCTFTGNTTTKSGGGMYNNYNPTVNNCTFSGNSASLYGGGMYNGYEDSYGSPTVTNCILWGDTPDEIHNDYSSTATVTYSDVEGGWGGTGNINADPCFADPGYWDANGTPADANDDFWIDGDYHLKSEAGRWEPDSQTWIKDDVTSPGIDAGDPNSDWRGELWPHGGHINMGAYGGTPEASMSLSDAGNIADIDVDGQIGGKDTKLLIEKWLFEEVLLPEDLNRDGIVNFTDYAIFAHICELPARNPNPADGALGVSITADLSWTPGRGATSHDVYFGTSNPPPFIGNQSLTTFDPGEMAYITEYFWRIDELNTTGKTIGVVWSFTTHSSPPP